MKTVYIVLSVCVVSVVGIVAFVVIGASVTPSGAPKIENGPVAEVAGFEWDPVVIGNCAADVPGDRIDDLALEVETRTVTLSWWDDTINDNTSLVVPFDVESGFAGCSESVKGKLLAIQHTYEENNPGLSWDEIYAQYATSDAARLNGTQVTLGPLSLTYYSDVIEMSSTEFAKLANLESKNSVSASNATDPAVVYLVSPDAEVRGGDGSVPELVSGYAIQIGLLGNDVEEPVTLESLRADVGDPLDEVALEHGTAVFLDEEHAYIFDGTGVAVAAARVLQSGEPARQAGGGFRILVASMKVGN